MRTDSDKTQVNYLFVENVIVENEVEKNVENHIGATCYTIPENFAGDKP